MPWSTRCAPLEGRPVTATSSGSVGARPRLQTVPLTRIAGSISRCCDFDRCFRVLRRHLRPRLDGARQHWGGRPLSPVRLVEDETGYWVVDGHHRLALAHERGMVAVDALVTTA